MSYSVLLHPRVAKDLNKLESLLRDRIKSALRNLQESPSDKGEKMNPAEYWKIRIGDYRAIYQIDDKAKRVTVLFVGHRSKVYDDFRRML
ncbi:MAG: type II toxin-antitoxin system RelE/ParE family toxin [Nitrososphaerales archaeon]